MWLINWYQRVVAKKMVKKGSKKPATQKESGEKDTASYPNEEDVVKMDKKEMRGSISGELYEQVMLTAGTLGFNKAEVLGAALSDWVSTNAVNTKESIKRKAEYFGISEKEVISKIHERYQKASRSIRSRLQNQDEEELKG